MLFMCITIPIPHLVITTPFPPIVPCLPSHYNFVLTFSHPLQTTPVIFPGLGTFSWDGVAHCHPSFLPSPLHTGLLYLLPVYSPTCKPPWDRPMPPLPAVCYLLSFPCPIVCLCNAYKLLPNIYMHRHTDWLWDCIPALCISSAPFGAFLSPSIYSFLPATTPAPPVPTHVCAPQWDYSLLLFLVGMPCPFPPVPSPYLTQDLLTYLPSCHPPWPWEAWPLFWDLPISPFPHQPHPLPPPHVALPPPLHTFPHALQVAGDYPPTLTPALPCGLYLTAPCWEDLPLPGWSGLLTPT